VWFNPKLSIPIPHPPPPPNPKQQPPVKGYAVLGIDPGLRTGCKAALVSPTGVLLDARTFFPEAGGGEGAVREVVGIVERHRKTIGHRLVFALGNGKGRCWGWGLGLRA
jgi:hypothetical protein